MIEKQGLSCRDSTSRQTIRFQLIVDEYKALIVEHDINLGSRD